MEILVPESTAKTDILKLAHNSYSRYSGQGMVVILIYDSKEAWQNRDNDAYPQALYMKHFLVSTITGSVNWTAEGRDH